MGSFRAAVGGGSLGGTFAGFLAFTPSYKKSQRKPASVCFAFVVALALEIFGVPLSMYVLAGVLGSYLPDGVLWGHTLNPYTGLWLTNVATVIYLVAVVPVFLGWRDIYRHYWSKRTGQAGRGGHRGRVRGGVPSTQEPHLAVSALTAGELERASLTASLRASAELSPD